MAYATIPQPPADGFFEAIAERLEPGKDLIRVLLIGDVLGRPGRRILRAVLPRLRELARVDFVVANGENAAGGFGITEKIYHELRDMGVDVITMGNHWADKADVHRLLETEARLIVPANLTQQVVTGPIPEFPIAGRPERVMVLNLLGNFAMKPDYGNPFEVLEPALPSLTSLCKSGSRFLLVDMHAEANSEKQAVAWYLDGVAAAVVGTHTHTPTSDERILPKGTAYLSDLGMVGPYESVIGMNVGKTVQRYLPSAKRSGAHEVATHDAWFTALLVEVDPGEGLARAAHRVQFREGDGSWSVSSVGRKRA